jgi:ABC-type molybdate transport system substrate-binding protein
MKKNFISFVCLTIIGLGLSLTHPAWAQTPDVCETLPAAGKTSDLNLAVASNFFEPGKDVINRFLATTAGSGMTIQICHNASGLLVTEINGGNPKNFGLFLAANDSFPKQINQALQDGDPFTYAKGIPVLYSKILTPAQLIEDGKINTTLVTKLAIASTVNAPYGIAAQAILELFLEQWDDSYVTPAPCDPSKRTWICEYANVDLTFNAINSGDPPAEDAGFVSKAQICKIQNASFVDFGSNFYFNQDGIKILVSTQQVTAAETFKTFLLDPATQAYLVSNWCYASTNKSLNPSK